MRSSRRGFLAAGAALGAGAALDRIATGDGAGTAAAAGTPRDGAGPGAQGLTTRVPFDGRHQAGILTPQPRHALVMAFDAITATRGELAEAVRALSVRGRRLTAGHPTLIGAAGDGPTADSGMLGVRVPPDALTVTIGFGASLFDGRYGLSGRRPAGLKAMPAFPDDALVDDECHGDVLVQLCANTEETLLNAIRDLMRETRGALAPRWKIEGHVPERREPGAQRNLLGFKDGTGNPATGDAELMNRFVWDRDGGTYAVVRIIRNRVEFWDRVARAEQEAMIGRDKATGAPLGGQAEHDDPDYAGDPHGKRVPLGAHIRLARPRTPETEGERILRRGFSYSRGVDLAGQLDMGLLFVAFNRNLERQFEAIQHRLAGEGLTDYVKPTGGGYFYLPAGAQGDDDWVGSTLLS